MSQISRTWVQQDFCELYEQEPKVLNASTYVTVQLNIDSDSVSVKIPSKAPEDVARFLLYKAVYFYYLNQRHANPLHRTAQIACFESLATYGCWYDLWAGRGSIPKGVTLHCVAYLKEESISKYVPLAMIEQRPEFSKILARSRQNGKYVNICVYSHELVNQDFLLFLENNYKLLQHPFLAKVVEIFRTRSHSYFVFEHNPFSYSQILNSGQKLSKQQVYASFVELLLGLAFLEQQQQLLWELDLEMLEIGADGHFVINEKVILNHQKTHTERNRANLLFLSELFNTLICSSEIIEDQLNEQNELQVSFAKFLIDLCEVSQQRKVSVKEILSHRWIDQSSNHKILAKSVRPFATQGIEKQSPFRELTRAQIQQFYKQYLRHPAGTVTYQNFQMASQSANQAIMKKYTPTPQTVRPDSIRKRGLKIASFNSATIHVNNNSSEDLCSMVKPRLTCFVDKPACKSPYLSVLKKQGYHRRKKPMQVA